MGALGAVDVTPGFILIFPTNQERSEEPSNEISGSPSTWCISSLEVSVLRESSRNQMKDGGCDLVILINILIGSCTSPLLYSSHWQMYPRSGSQSGILLS